MVGNRDEANIYFVLLVVSGDDDGNRNKRATEEARLPEEGIHLHTDYATSANHFTQSHVTRCSRHHQELRIHNKRYFFSLNYTVRDLHPC